METRQLATYMGKDPATGERIMAVSSPMIYSSGEVIGVLRYVTSMKVVNRQLVFVTLVALAAGALLVLVVIFSSNFYIRSILEPGSGDHGHGQADCRRQLRRAAEVQIRR